jgi:hypothetical protein
VARGIFEPKEHEVTGRRKKLQNTELHNMYSPLNIIRESKQGGLDGRSL